MAGELGYYKDAGLRVRLSREVGWSSVLNKVVLGQLDAAHAIGTMPIAATLGLVGRACPCGTAMVINQGGNGISFSTSVRQRGVESAEEFRQEVRSSRWARTYTLGVVSSISTHRHILMRWLQKLRLQPGKDVKVVTVPPGQALRNLAAGTLDGFCVGDPWHSLAARRGIGWTIALGSDLFPSAPEKVVMTTRRFAEDRPEEHIAFLAAVIRACRYCQNPEHADHLASVLGSSSYLGIDDSVLSDIYQGSYLDGVENMCKIEHLINFGHGDANRPTEEVARFYLDALASSSEGEALKLAEFDGLKQVFWEDLYDEAERAAQAMG